MQYQEIHIALMKEYREKSLAAANRYMLDVETTIDKLSPEYREAAGVSVMLATRIVDAHAEAILESVALYLANQPTP